MSALNRKGRWNPGGGHYLEIILASTVSYTRLPKSSVAIIAPRAGSFSVWTRLYCTPGTLEFNQQHSPTDNGDLYTVTITGFHPDDDADESTALGGFMQGQQIIARFKDYQPDRVRLVGTPIEYLTLSYKFETGSDVPDSRGYTISLKGTLTQPAAYES